MWNIMTTKDVKSDELLGIFKQVRNFQRTHMRSYSPTRVEGRIMATLFMEPSTRTRLSFEAAMVRLGGAVIGAHDVSSMSIAKGESVSDTIENVARFVNLVVVRSSYPYQEWFFQHGTREWKGPPIINGGDGSHNHPTQAIGDAYTIWKHFGGDSLSPFVQKKLTHCVIGDVGQSRTIKSYMELMSRQANHIFYIRDSTGHGKELENVSGLNIYYLNEPETVEAIKKSDVIYINRVQKERHGDRTSLWHNTFQLTSEHLNTTPGNCIVLDPGPVDLEMDLPTRYHPKVKMFDQAENGMYCRMALISRLLNG